MLLATDSDENCICSLFSEEVYEHSLLDSKSLQAGVSLTKIEESGVLSTAENLGLLSLAEGALQSDPGNVTALSLPLIVATICK